MYFNFHEKKENSKKNIHLKDKNEFHDGVAYLCWPFSLSPFFTFVRRNRFFKRVKLIDRRCFRMSLFFCSNAADFFNHFSLSFCDAFGFKLRIWDFYFIRENMKARKINDWNFYEKKNLADEFNNRLRMKKEKMLMDLKINKKIKY